MAKSTYWPRNRRWDSLICGFCLKKKDPEKALSVLRECLRNQGIIPSSFTFRSLIHGFSSQGKMDRAIEVLELMTDGKFRYPFDNFVCSSIISGFCKIGKPELAVGFFENAESWGALQPNIVTYTALVNALCELGRVNEVSDLVSRIEKERLKFDVVFYSSWICGYLKEEILEGAIRKYRQMVQSGINPDTISYTILIDGFSKQGNVEKAAGFLELMKKDGLKPNLVTYTAIMLGFCKKGKLEEAFAVFKMVEDLGFKVDEFTYATLIDGVCRSGDFDRVFNLLDDMEKKGISVSIVTYNSVISGLCKVGRTSEADEVSKDKVGDIVTYSTLLHGYVEEENVTGILETKRRLENAGVSLDVVTCNILIKALFLIGAYEDVLIIYKRMEEMDLLPDSVTFCTMIDGYCKAGRIDDALKIFDEFRRTPISSVACYSCIIHGLCRKGMAGMAIEVSTELGEKGLVLDVGTYRMLMKAIFEEQRADGVLNLVHRIENLGPEIYDIICNDAICFLCKRGLFESACNAFVVMRSKGSVVSSKSYYSIIKGLISEGKWWMNLAFLNSFIKEYGLVECRVSKQLLHYLCMKDVNNALWFIEKTKNTSTVSFPVTVLKSLTKNGRVLDAYKLVTEAEGSLPAMDVVDYSIMVDGLCKGGHLYTALDLCAFAKKKGIILNMVTFNSVINGLCAQGCLVEAFRLFDSLGRIDLVPSEITYATLIDALCKEGFLHDANKLFERMVLKGLNPNIRVYNSLIDGYCKFNQLKEALKLLLDLKKRCLKPDEFTVSAVINGFCQKGDMEGALEFFYEFKMKSILPDFLGYLYLIRGLFTKGRMEEARSILRKMLQTQCVVELINRVDVEVKTESIGSFLIFLCEQGSIKEAVTVLNEVACTVFPFGRSLGSDKLQKSKKLSEGDNFGVGASKFLNSTNKTDSDLGLRKVDKMDKVVESCYHIEKRSQFHDFDAYYSLIASFCSRGKLWKANRLVKEMLSDFNKGL